MEWLVISSLAFFIGALFWMAYDASHNHEFDD